MKKPTHLSLADKFNKRLKALKRIDEKIYQDILEDAKKIEGVSITKRENLKIDKRVFHSKSDIEVKLNRAIPKVRAKFGKFDKIKSIKIKKKPDERRKLQSKINTRLRNLKKFDTKTYEVTIGQLSDIYGISITEKGYIKIDKDIFREKAVDITTSLETGTPTKKQAQARIALAETENAEINRQQKIKELEEKYNSRIKEIAEKYGVDENTLKLDATNIEGIAEDRVKDEEKGIDTLNIKIDENATVEELEQIEKDLKEKFPEDNVLEERSLSETGMEATKDAIDEESRKRYVKHHFSIKNIDKVFEEYYEIMEEGSTMLTDPFKESAHMPAEARMAGQSYATAMKELGKAYRNFKDNPSDYYDAREKVKKQREIVLGYRN